MARPDNMTTTTPVDPDKWPNRYITLDPNASETVFEQVAELAETCRVLTELAQQLTNALAALDNAYAIDDLDDYNFDDEHTRRTQAALDAAAELGITPIHQP